jgi:hypothetical protein
MKTQVLATKKASITPYCLDLARKRVIFVEVDPADLERAISKAEIPFLYQVGQSGGDRRTNRCRF